MPCGSHFIFCNLLHRFCVVTVSTEAQGVQTGHLRTDVLFSPNEKVHNTVTDLRILMRPATGANSTGANGVFGTFVYVDTFFFSLP
jgi:hypothetical protein